MLRGRSRALPGGSPTPLDPCDAQDEGARGGTQGLPHGSYIMPPMSGMPPPTGAFFSGASATIASVVRMFFAIDAAFCSA